MARLKVGVLISGRGSNLQALIESCRNAEARAEIVLVVSNRPEAAGLAHARAGGIRSDIVDHRAFSSRAEFDAELDRRLRAAGVEFLCLAGFMRLLTDGFVAAWRDRMLNIHPSLLPSFPGLDTHARAIAAGVRFSGCTVHFVRPQTDTGPILVQAVVPVLQDDSPERLAARVLAAEHRAYPLALRLVAEGRVRVENERAVVAGATAPLQVLLSPVDPAG